MALISVKTVFFDLYFGHFDLNTASFGLQKAKIEERVARLGCRSGKIWSLYLSEVSERRRKTEGKGEKVVLIKN